MAAKVSPFLSPGPVASTNNLAIVHLKRDYQIPAVLRDRDENDEGYAEGKVLNCQFGSFPHSTLIGLPWGSQVRASKVDTGSRGRRGKKRSRADSEGGDSEQGSEAAKEAKAAVAANSGFVHLLDPTPENWTSSLPHRTQVVYTPDYSYILHRIRARPGSTLIEAGAGSGSFTHASARAVFSGYGRSDTPASKRRKLGKVWSYEFHEQRFEKLKTEIADHGLEGLVEITHRDVCQDGFLVGEKQDQSPKANAIFLDLPAPWVALPHLARSAPPKLSTSTPTSTDGNQPAEPLQERFVSPLDPSSPVHICSFSPCIEQVQRTVSDMRKLGWVDISVVEVSQKRLEIRRERVTIEQGPARGVQVAPATVEEALGRLREVEGRTKNYHEGQKASEQDVTLDEDIEAQLASKKSKAPKPNPNSHEKIIERLAEGKVYKQGRLIHRTEDEIKTHTSYLVFAILPQEWTEEDEAKAAAKYAWVSKSGGGSGQTGTQKGAQGGEDGEMSNRQRKKLEKEARRQESTDKPGGVDAGQEASVADGKVVAVE